MIGIQVLFIAIAVILSGNGIQSFTIPSSRRCQLRSTSSFHSLQKSGTSPIHYPQPNNSEMRIQSSTREMPEDNPPKNRNPFRFLTRLIMNFLLFPYRITKLFLSLSKKAKTLLVFQMVLLSVVLGGIATRSGTIPQLATLNRIAVPKVKLAPKRKAVEVPYSLFMDLAEQSGKGHKVGEHPAIKLDNVIISKDKISFRVDQDDEKHKLALKDGSLVKKNDVSVQEVKPREVYTYKVPASPDLVEFMRGNQLDFRAASTKANTVANNSIKTVIVGVYIMLLYRMYQVMSGGAGGSGGAFPGRLFRKTKKVESGEPLVTFDEIQGIDKAKFEVMELVDTLRNPQKYAVLGARAPTGLLLVGPPGTGKTMLARATAATAGVPMLYCSGSDFVEMFVGRGAARVRKTFERAAKLAPCIVFIDELDALGKARDKSGLRLQSNDEADQTLNQLLACMDGLDSSKRVCVLAATNRREILDSALVRPGRFDRIIQLELPDAKGRENILRVHARKLPGFTECSGVDEKRLGSLGKGAAVDLSAVASVTSGLAGAELEFIVNEAAIRAVRRVTSSLREGVDPSEVVPQVTAKDFEASLQNFYETRKQQQKGVGDFIDNFIRK